MVSSTALIVEVIVGAIILAPVLWLVGRAIVGKAASLIHALWMVILGVINAILGMFVHGLLGLLVTLVLWLVLIKQFFATSWGKAALVALVAVVVLAIIAVILAVLGIGALAGLLSGA